MSQIGDWAYVGSMFVLFGALLLSTAYTVGRLVLEIYQSNQKAATAVAEKYHKEAAALKAKGKEAKMPKQETWPFEPSSHVKMWGGITVGLFFTMMFVWITFA